MTGSVTKCLIFGCNDVMLMCAETHRCQYNYMMPHLHLIAWTVIETYRTTMKEGSAKGLIKSNIIYYYLTYTTSYHSLETHRCILVIWHLTTYNVIVILWRTDTLLTFTVRVFTGMEFHSFHIFDEVIPRQTDNARHGFDKAQVQTHL